MRNKDARIRTLTITEAELIDRMRKEGVLIERRNRRPGFHEGTLLWIREPYMKKEGEFIFCADLPEEERRKRYWLSAEIMDKNACVRSVKVTSVIPVSRENYHASYTETVYGDPLKHGLIAVSTGLTDGKRVYSHDEKDRSVYWLVKYRTERGFEEKRRLK